MSPPRSMIGDRQGRAGIRISFHLILARENNKQEILPLLYPTWIRLKGLPTAPAGNVQEYVTRRAILHRYSTKPPHRPVKRVMRAAPKPSAFSPPSGFVTSRRMRFFQPRDVSLTWKGSRGFHGVLLVLLEGLWVITALGRLEVACGSREWHIRWRVV